VEDALADDILADIAADPHVARMRRRLGELKVEPVVKLLTEQLEDSDEKIVVFAHHRNVLDGLGRGLSRAGFGIMNVNGDTSPTARDTAIDMFQTEPSIRVFIGQNIACQTGITLTAARRVVLVEPDWTADVNLQLGKRIARIGQRAERCVGQLIALAGTLDEAIVAQNQREVRMAETLGLGST
jgi:SWI/SNF-related matrix-associated actin-dependent regulator 1 of chromatin subfamily A